MSPDFTREGEKKREKQLKLEILVRVWICTGANLVFLKDKRPTQSLLTADEVDSADSAVAERQSNRQRTAQN